MKFYVGVTDKAWFEFLASRQPDEVNFWRPSGTTAFRAVAAGEPFLFKLHSPHRFIVGGGFFVGYAALPLSLAWMTFAEKNGVADFRTFASRISYYRNRSQPPEHDPRIGCIVLNAPFFFREDEWIPEPENWSSNLVQGRTYSTAEPIGASLWQQVQERLQHASVTPNAATYQIAETQARYGTEYTTRSRLGQGAFRVLVTEAYKQRCAITGEKTLPVLQASHIKPFSQDGPNEVSNGLLLRSDLHILFDRGYLTVDPQLYVEISSRIKEEFENGREYYALHGKPLVVQPTRLFERPSPEYLDWHNQQIFLP